MTVLFTKDFDKICRFCLCKNREMRPLFGSFVDNMLHIVAEIDVQAGDGLQVSPAFTFKNNVNVRIKRFARILVKSIKSIRQTMILSNRIVMQMLPMFVGI